MEKFTTRLTIAIMALMVVLSITSQAKADYYHTASIDHKKWAKEFYKVKDKVHFDLCRGSQVNIFDLYYDKFGKGSLQGIDFGKGNINPSMWGYKTKEKKKKGRRG